MREREREREQEGQRENPKQAPCCQHRAQQGAGSHKQWDLSWAETKKRSLNPLSHPGARLPSLCEVLSLILLDSGYWSLFHKPKGHLESSFCMSASGQRLPQTMLCKCSRHQDTPDLYQITCFIWLCLTAWCHPYIYIIVLCPWCYTETYAGEGISPSLFTFVFVTNVCEYMVSMKTPRVWKIIEFKK